MSLDTDVGLPASARRRRRPSSCSAATRGSSALFEPALVRTATWQSFVMLDPRDHDGNPVMFLVEVGTVLTAIVTVQSIVPGARHRPDRLPGVADRPAPADGAVRQLRRGAGRGPRQGPGRQPARDPRRRRPPSASTTWTVRHRARSSPRPSSGAGDHVVVEAGQVIPADGEIVEGVASVDESAITGEIGPGHPRGRRRPLRRHRRHARPLRPHRRRRSPPSAGQSRSSTG